MMINVKNKKKIKVEYKYSFSYVLERKKVIKIIFRRYQKCVFQKSRKKIYYMLFILVRFSYFLRLFKFFSLDVYLSIVFDNQYFDFVFLS